jgi:preprotein translocase subunit SecB
MLRTFSIKKNYVKEIKMIITNFPHSKNTQCLKGVEFEIFRNSTYVFLNIKFSKKKSPHVNGV